MADDERATVESIMACRRIIGVQVERHGGRVVDSPGDALLAEFPSAVEALDCAQEIQQQLVKRNAQFADHRRMQFRIGINLGDVIEENGCLYGDGVNVAARLESLCEPGSVCVSGTVFDQVDGKVPASFKFAGEQTVKNIAKPVRVYHVVRSEHGSARHSGLMKRPLKVVIGAIVLTVAVGVLIWEATHSWKASVLRSGDSVLTMPSGPRVAVLPFANLSGDPKQDYFSDGLTEDVITELARFRDMYVLARNTTQEYRGKTVNIPAVGRELGVRYILEGSVRRTEKQILITAQLIDVQTGAHVWAERYDRPVLDMFAVQKEIADRIAATIGSGMFGAIPMADRQTATRRSANELQAYDHVLLATMLPGWWTKDGYPKAKEHLERALALSPNYARARQEYAYLLLLGWILNWEPTPAPPDALKKNALDALNLDPSDPLVHRTAAFAYFFDHDLAAFDREARTALALAPNNAQILSELGFLYAVSGQWERGRSIATKGHELNAAAAAGWYYAALFYDFYRTRNYGAALEAIKQHPNQDIVENQ